MDEKSEVSLNGLWKKEGSGMLVILTRIHRVDILAAIYKVEGRMQVVDSGHYPRFRVYTSIGSSYRGNYVSVLPKRKVNVRITDFYQEVGDVWVIHALVSREKIEAGKWVSNKK